MTNCTHKRVLPSENYFDNIAFHKIILFVVVRIFNSRKNPNGCDLKGTFFLTHHYSDYHNVSKPQRTKELSRRDYICIFSLGAQREVKSWYFYFWPFPPSMGSTKAQWSQLSLCFLKKAFIVLLWEKLFLKGRVKYLNSEHVRLWT